MHISYRKTFLISLLTFFVTSLPVFAALDAEPAPKSIDVSVNNTPYTFPYRDAMYGTLAGYLNIKNVNVPGERIFNLDVPGFRSSVPVHAVIQPGSAPLAIVLLGISGQASADFSRQWPAWFAEAGYHVLFFDSTFRTSYLYSALKGPAGNVWSESEAVRDIINAFLQRGDMQQKVSAIGIAGMSYGGTQALILGQMAREGRLPFAVNAIQAFSPPINLDHTAEIFDRWYREDRWCYTLMQLQSKVAMHKPLADDSCGVPLSQKIMRAASAASFHVELTPVVLKTDERFCLNLLPHSDALDAAYVREEHANAWGFSQYAYNMALPYWQSKLGQDAVNTLIVDTQLCELLRNQPPYSETIIALNDPFDDPADMDDLKLCSEGKRVTFLPHGGHLGYAGDSWTRAKLLSMFAQPKQVGVK